MMIHILLHKTANFNKVDVLCNFKSNSLFNALIASSTLKNNMHVYFCLMIHILLHETANNNKVDVLCTF